jgi:hypothetical protein
MDARYSSPAWRMSTELRNDGGSIKDGIRHQSFEAEVFGTY